jgi:uncharacterized membrane protein
LKVVDLDTCLSECGDQWFSKVLWLIVVVAVVDGGADGAVVFNGHIGLES